MQVHTLVTLALACLLLIPKGEILSEEPASYNIQPVDSLPCDEKLKEAIQTSRENFGRFADVWKARPRNCDQFFVALISKNGKGKLIPIGLEVTSMDSDTISGIVIKNTLPYRHTEETLTVNRSEVVDWRYRDTLILEGGYVYRELFERLGQREKRNIASMLPFGMECDAKVTEAREFFRNPSEINFKAIEQIDANELFFAYFPAKKGNHNDGDVCVTRGQLTIGKINCVFGNYASTRMLVERGYIKEVQADVTPFFSCSDSEGTETAKALIDIGFDVNLKVPILNRTTLHAAVKNDKYELSKLLLEKGANPNPTGNDLRTPLFYVWNAKMIDLLIYFGADVNATDSQGMTPYDLFVQNGDEELIDAIVKHGGKASGKNFIYDPRMPFDYQIEFGSALPIAKLQ